ncbi:hypothetical protein PHYC_02495 [Phycisphaerales bacterium]|nr:hypothetical protein PHYC_02495 [Phycisphaerales bacterium]
MSPDELRAVNPNNLYLAYHAPRFAVLLRLLAKHARPGRVGGTLLDIGESVCTPLMGRQQNCTPDSLGLGPDRNRDGGGRHFEFDLHNCQDEARWRRGLPTYDAVVFAEVIEHLHVAPSLVLRFLRSLLNPGGVLILQTPNALALHKRLLMLAGRHPYEKIRENPAIPGHIREYTLDELRDYAAGAGLNEIEVVRESYFDYRYRFDPRDGHHHHTPRGRWMNTLYRFVPGSMQRGITMVLTNPG